MPILNRELTYPFSFKQLYNYKKMKGKFNMITSKRTNKIIKEIKISEQQIAQGKIKSAKESLSKLKKKYNLY